MTYAIQLSKKTLNYLKKLDKSQKEKIIAVFQKIIEDPYRFKPLRYELKGYYRARIETYRILFRIENNTVFIAGIEQRKKAYK